MTPTQETPKRARRGTGVTQVCGCDPGREGKVCPSGLTGQHVMVGELGAEKALGRSPTPALWGPLTHCCHPPPTFLCS